VTGAGNSAARQAAALRARARRGLWRRVLAVLGFRGTDTATEAVAACWDLGAAAEQHTARMLHALHTRGWHILNDRALPGSRANLDHVLISPCGTAVVVLDTKRWHAQRPTWLVRGRVHCGTDDRHGQIEAVAGYASRVARALDMEARSVWPLLVVHGSRIQGGRLEVRAARWPGPVHVLGPEWLVPTLASAPKRRDPVRAGQLAARAAAVLPPYR
jgi:hypothetical protein